jgi:hypothetical protein
MTVDPKKVINTSPLMKCEKCFENCNRNCKERGSNAIAIILLIASLFLFNFSFSQVKTDNQLNVQADSIKNATTSGFNTATRIGTMYKDIIAAKINKGDSASYVTIFKQKSDSATLAAATNAKPTFGDIRQTVSDSLQGFIRLQTQNPTASLNSDSSYERRASGTGTVILNYTAGRQAATANAAATAPISTIVVNGVSKTFTQPAVGASVSGTATATVTYNTNTTFTNVVTTTDTKTVAATRSINVFDKRYIGWAATTTPTDAEIRAAIAQDNSGGSGNYSANLAQLTSALYLFEANTITCSSVVLNGFPSTSNFNLNVSRTFTNSSGGQTTYYVSTITAPTGNVSATSVTFN